jgi:hypothetical protein
VKPSLLHGDLWSGNMTGVKGGGWAIIDPATYYGHSEAEFGMSWCAGFDQSFWRGYHEIIPRAPGTQAPNPPLWFLFWWTELESAMFIATIDEVSMSSSMFIAMFIARIDEVSMKSSILSLEQ